jgi:predicted metal-dependent hydrolase
LVVPRGTGATEIERLLDRNRNWIARKSAWAQEIASRPSALGLDRPGVVWLGGEAIPIRRRSGSRAVAELGAGALFVSGPPDRQLAAIGRWYRREARRRLGAAVDRHGPRLGVVPTGLGIRDPRTRWGSCSAKGRLSFSWRLLIGPVEVLDYVVVHELCHLRHLDHSAAFWRLLDAARPGWRAEAAWLEEHSHEIGSYEPQLAPSPISATGERGS